MSNITPSEYITELLFELVSNNIYASTNDIFETAIYKRFIGFRAELAFSVFMGKREAECLPGGYFLPLKEKQATLNAPVYFTVSSKDQNDLSEIYSYLSRLKLSKLFYIKAKMTSDFNKWKTMRLFDNSSVFIVPDIEVFEFSGSGFNKTDNGINSLLNIFTKKVQRYRHAFRIESDFKEKCVNLLKNYDLKYLIELYVSRLIFDGMIGLNYSKGIPSDIDSIILNNGKYLFVEVKEKDKSKTIPFGFGIDVQRLYDIIEIGNKTGIDYYYVVRQVDNQNDRKFLNWRYLSFQEFYEKADKKNVKDGGRGMDTVGNQKRPTIMTAETHFKYLDAKVPPFKDKLPI